MKLPPSRGYSVNLKTGTVHTRHPDSHAGEVRKAATPTAVEYLVGERRIRVCRVCFPARTKVSVEAPQTGQERRNGSASVSGLRHPDTGDTLPDPHLPAE